MPSVSFEDSTSPQRRALDWMLGDSYSLALKNDDDRIVQRFALAVLYYATMVENRASWLLSSTECGWGKFYDVTCTNDVVGRLQLVRSRLSGTIPGEIGLLNSLTELNLRNNNLEGTIPTEIGFLSSLLGLYLDLGNANLSGRVPTELANLSNLRELSLHNTQLTGSIPSELCNTLERAW
eukprot:CAMPEP_0194035652 /NCGR_PEP_ID=MMETSP0009_2-20130614/8061_1 /TAXON_ID=210454 /ORGANISM="Grammatophora oceanica, Strain CCMP 410" /LENGTH=179 /DNA_ID=CAMNT_0038677091 /DNA_START=129 /DNA_END=665 /DNA_ORIENTATION=+